MLGIAKLMQVISVLDGGAMCTRIFKHESAAPQALIIFGYSGNLKNFQTELKNKRIRAISL